MVTTTGGLKNKGPMCSVCKKRSQVVRMVDGGPMCLECHAARKPNEPKLIEVVE